MEEHSERPLQGFHANNLTFGGMENLEKDGRLPMKEEDKQPPQKDLEGQRRVKSDNFMEIEENLGQDLSYVATEQL